jgi:hypothetical protein
VRALTRPSFDWPPADRFPAHIRAALAAEGRREAGGRALSMAEVEALVDLSSWAFNGVAPEHPQFEQRFESWCLEATERHARRLLRDQPSSD